MRKKTVKDIRDLHNKRIFLTVDFNISLSDGKIANDTRIHRALPTINYLLSQGCKLIIASHLGRPKGYDKSLTLLPVAQKLSHYLKQKVSLMDHFWDTDALTRIKEERETKVILLENIRFFDGEKRNDIDFSKHLASMADFFVNDAFGASHRIHSSTVGIAEFLPPYAGLLLDKEISVLSDALEKPKHPFLVVIGGAKTPEKISVIEKILDIADTVVLGGAIANTFLAAWGFGMGKSAIDYEMVEMARVVFWNASRKHSALILPMDVVISDHERKKAKEVVDYDHVPQDASIFDIGPKTRKLYIDYIQKAKTIIWNGPMGLFEDKRFASGTQDILKNISASQAFTIVGGGDTLTSINAEKYFKKIDHVSTGGSAMLEFLKKGSLPGIDVLQDA